MLEQRIEELTAAVKALTEVFTLVKAEAESKQEPASKKSPSAASNTGPDAASETAPAHAEQPSTQEAETPQTTSPTSEPTEPESAPVTYDDVKKVTIALSKISKDQAIGALAKFGVASAKQLVEAQWGNYVDFVNGVLQDAD